MEVNDFLLCTFKADSTTLPIYYAAEITGIDTGGRTLSCRMPDTGQQFAFDTTTEPWRGTDGNGQSYELATHVVYTGGRVDPFVNGAAIVTFADGAKYLALVKSIDPSTQISLYTGTVANMDISNNVVSQSDWDRYPVGTQVTNMEGCEEADADVVSDVTDATGTTEHTQFLFVDTYALDVDGKQRWDVLAKTPKFYGAIIKSTEGTGYTGGDWFKKNWPALKEAGGDRYGKTWFRGAYHFLKFNKDGAAQADYYLKNIDAAGGWDNGDILPVIDVELGNDGSKNPAKRNSNHDASAQQIIDCTTACANRLREQTGRNVILYGRGAMRDKGIKSKMGCDAVWNPAYTRTMVRNGLDAWTLDDIVLWQYCGDGTAAVDPSKLPRSIPGFGITDISVYIDGANKPTLESLIRRLGIGT